MKVHRGWLLLVAASASCEIADRTVTGAPAGGAGGTSAGSPQGGAPAGFGAGLDAQAGEAASGGAFVAADAGEGGGGAVLTAAGAGGEPSAGAGGAPVVEPVVCDPACEGSTPVCVEGLCQAPTSCGALAEELCGETGLGSCCDSIQVPAGSFKRSFDDVTFTDDTDGATLSTFALDKLEVTVGRFKRFVSTGHATRANPPPVGSGRVRGQVSTGWKEAWNEELMTDKAALASALKCGGMFYTWADSVGVGSEHLLARPINCVTWYEAQAFCIWDGGRLPTEAEWNYAAAAGNQQRAYPWSSPPTSTAISASLASHWVDVSKQCQGEPGNDCVPADIVTAGKKTGESLWGHRDLAGNVAEWTYDFFAESYHNPCLDCVEPNNSAARVVRGGAFGSDASGVLSSYREGQSPTLRLADNGFRCVYEGE